MVHVLRFKMWTLDPGRGGARLAPRRLDTLRNRRRVRLTSDSTVFGAGRSAAREAPDDGKAVLVWVRQSLHSDRSRVMPTRRTLLASAALAPLLTAGPRVADAQVETQGEAPAEAPIATPQASALPDLTGVTPLPLTGERLAAFEAYVAAKLAESERPRRRRRRRPGRRGRLPARASASASWDGRRRSPPTPCCGSARSPSRSARCWRPPWSTPGGWTGIRHWSICCRPSPSPTRISRRD